MVRFSIRFVPNFLPYAYRNFSSSITDFKNKPIYTFNENLGVSILISSGEAQNGSG